MAEPHLSKQGDPCHRPALLTVDSAIEQILASLQDNVIDTELLPIKHCRTRICAADIVAPLSLPTDCNSSMDGYAINYQDYQNGTRQFQLVGTSWAGRPYNSALQSGQCVRIFTGAILPEHADTVVMQEDAQQHEQTVQFNPAINANDNIRDAGEDVSAGDLVIPSGTRIGTAEIGMLAALGIVSIQVRRQLRIGFFSSGDELRATTEQLQAGQLYDSNRYSLHAMIEEYSAIPVDYGVVGDDPQQLQAVLETAAQQCDVVISSGGASVGDADFMQSVLQSSGAVSFWKLAIKPGKPLIYGQVQNTPYFGLPGNPVSVMITFMILVRPALDKLMGKQHSQPLIIDALLAEDLTRSAGREEYQRAILSRQNQQLVVTPLSKQGSNILSSMVNANCLLIIPVPCAKFNKGDTVKVMPFKSDLTSLVHFAT